MIDSDHIINNGKYESQTSDRSRTIPKADGSSYRRRESDRRKRSEAIDRRTLSSSASDSASSGTVGKTDQKSDYESLRSRFRFRPSAGARVSSAEMIFKVVKNKVFVIGDHKKLRFSE